MASILKTTVKVLADAAAAAFWSVGAAVVAGLVVSHLPISDAGCYAIVGLVQVVTFVNVLFNRD